MKKYLLIALLTSLSVQAENNPFELKENLQKIDQDQDILLSALKEMSGDKEAKEEILDAKEVNQNVASTPIIEKAPQSDVEVPIEKNIPAASSPASEDSAKEKPINQKLSEQKQQGVKHDVDSKAKAMAQVKKEKERLQEIKEAKVKIETQRKQALAEKKAAQIQQEKTLLAQKKQKEARKHEQERLEVEAYEKKRISKKEHEIKKIAMQSQSNDAVVDINITRERKLSKKEADKAYLEAVAEMDKED